MKNQLKLRQALTAPWLVHPDHFPSMLASLRQFAMEEGEPAEPEPIELDDLVVGRIAVIPLHGLLLQHPGQCGDCWGMTTYTEMWVEALEALAADPEVAGIVIDEHSPGGIIYGVPEAAARIRALRGTKPLFTVANALAASAGYWIGTAAERMYVTGSGDVGSVGVYIMHANIAKMLEEWGVEVTLIHAGVYKVEGNMFEALSDEARAELQRSVDEGLDAFVAGLVENLGVSEKDVRENFGQGRLVGAEEAVRRGMAYGVATLAEVIAECARVAGVPSVPALEGRGMPTSEVEIRTVRGPVSREEGDEWALQGTCVTYGQESADMGGWREVFERGAISQASLEHPDSRVIDQHDNSRVFGRVKSGTARFWVEGDAVRYGAIPPDTQWARDAMVSIGRGDIDQSSFGFRVLEGGVRWERRPGYDLRVITSAELVESGPQTFPAYRDTSVAVRERATLLQSGPPASAGPDDGGLMAEIERMESEVSI